MSFEEWYKTYWAFGSSTDRLRAERAWVMARASLQQLVHDLVYDRQTDKHLLRACDFLVEIGKFFDDHPELEPDHLPDHIQGPVGAPGTGPIEMPEKTV
jgi:hypothetical protein